MRASDFSPPLETRLLVLQPTPFCNIRCRYCYLPARDDKRRMRVDTAALAARRLAEDGLLGRELTVVWHAGEPLAVPPDWYEEAFAAIRAAVGPAVELSHAIQTNAMLVNERWCDLFLRHGVRVGVSVDGPAHLHDTQRVTRRGHGTHARVVRGMARLRAAGVPFHAIAVVTAAALAEADAFAQFFVDEGVAELGCNFDEAEGGHLQSSLSGHEAQHRAFLQKLFEHPAVRSGRLRVRERDRALQLLASPLPQRRWGARAAPDNIQTLPFLCVNVAHDGRFSTFSPELLGQPAPAHGDFVLGNVHEGGYLASTMREPFLSIWGEIERGIEACRARCAHFDYCGGGAPANKLYETGSLASAETLYCRSMVQRPFELVLQAAEAELATAAAPG
jgi:uncharacterized protein